MEMDVTRAIQAAVARADLLACRVLALPWGRIGLSLLVAMVIYTCLKVWKERNDAH